MDIIDRWLDGDISAVSGDRMPQASVNKWATKASEMTFFGSPMAELGRTELLAAIGWLAEQRENDRKMMSLAALLQKSRQD
jgi:hypothetical protein